MSQSERQWETATAGAVAGFTTVAAMYPLDIVRTRFQVNDGRITNFPTYKNTAHAIFTITRLEGLRGLYAGFLPAVLGSTVSWSLYFFFYGRAKQRYSKNREEKLSSGLHLASAAEAGALVSLCTNPIWLIKTRMQLQNPLNQNRPYAGIYDAIRTILREEGWTALYKGLGPGLLMVVFWLFTRSFYPAFYITICLYTHTHTSPPNCSSNAYVTRGQMRVLDRGMYPTWVCSNPFQAFHLFGELLEDHTIYPSVDKCRARYLKENGEPEQHFCNLLHIWTLAGLSWSYSVHSI